MAEFATFAKFHNAEEASLLLSVLKEKNIPYNLKQERNQLDTIIIGNNMDPMLAVSIPVERFSEATRLMENIAAETPPQMYEPERLGKTWIVFGYIFSLLSIAGILGGLAIITSSKRLADGKKVSLYDDYTIRHGKTMLIIGIISSLLWLVYKIKSSDQY